MAPDWRFKNPVGWTGSRRDTEHDRMLLRVHYLFPLWAQVQGYKKWIRQQPAEDKAHLTKTLHDAVVTHIAHGIPDTLEKPAGGELECSTYYVARDLVGNSIKTLNGIRYEHCQLDDFETWRDEKNKPERRMVRAPGPETDEDAAKQCTCPECRGI